MGDLVLPETCVAGQDLVVAIEGSVEGAQTTLWKKTYVVAEPPDALPVRQRAVDFRDILAHPEFGAVTLAPYRFGATSKSDHTPVIAGVPHFHPVGSLPTFRLLDMKPTHKLGSVVEGLIDEMRGIGLDFGAGVPGPDRLRDNVVNLDVIHYPNVDVVNSYPRLPFRDNAFNLVFSLAVFEHLRDPRAAALEVARVLAPGGVFFLDAPFLVPLHGGPDHYFNMTMSGVREVLRGFEILEIGVRGNHAPSVMFAEEITAALPLVREGAWKQRLQAFLDDLRASGAELDADLGQIGRETLAAGAYALARRP